ncbi:MAG: hypothetical protein DWQ04_28720, partial [Chloroflexi bacterium]
LATSREPLNFQAESVIALDGLPTGVLEMSAAEALFGERGRMARDDFAVTADNLFQVRQICELVDGSPLGIALAAAWVRRRSLPQIIEGIGQSLDFLSSRLRDVDPRHRSVRAVFETSWQLLTAEEVSVLAALSVFPTTFTAVSAAQVAGATLFDLDLLCEKSLLQQQHELERYEMHSLLRQFAADKLAIRTLEVDRAFVHHFYQFAHTHQNNYAQLQPEWRNLLTAVTKAHAHQLWQQVISFVQVLDEPWFRQIRFQDMRHGLMLALEAAKALQDQPALARALLRLGEIEIELNDYSVAETHLGEAVQHFMRLEDSLGVAQSEYLYGRIKSEQGQDNEALKLFETSKQIFEEEKDWLGVAQSLNLIAVHHFKNSSNFQTAQRYLEQSAHLQRQLPITPTYVETLRYLVRIMILTEAYDAAEDYLTKASEVSLQLKDIGEYAAILFEHLLLCKFRQQFDEALAVGYDCLEQFKKLGSLRWEGLVNTQLGLLHQAKQEHEHGVILLLAGLHIFKELGDTFEQAYSYFYLYKLYAEMGKTELSLEAREQAIRLNLELKNPRLAERLE